MSRQEKQCPNRSTVYLSDQFYAVLYMEVARAHGMKAHTSARSPSQLVLYGTPDEVDVVVEAARKPAREFQAKVIKALVEILEANHLRVPLRFLRLCSPSEARGVAGMPTARPDDHSAAGSR